MYAHIIFSLCKMAKWPLFGEKCCLFNSVDRMFSLYCLLILVISTRFGFDDRISVLIGYCFSFTFVIKA